MPCPSQLSSCDCAARACGVRRKAMSENPSEAEPVSFGERLASSQAFSALFRDGMALVEETASLSRRSRPAGIQEARAQRRAGLCDRKHAADHAADAARLLAAAASRGEGRRDVARPGQQGKDQGEASSAAARPTTRRVKLLPETLQRTDRALAQLADKVRRLDATIHAASAPASTPQRPIRSSASSACSKAPSSETRKQIRNAETKNPAASGVFCLSHGAVSYFFSSLFRKPANFFWKRDSRPPRSSSCC